MIKHRFRNILYIIILSASIYLHLSSDGAFGAIIMVPDDQPTIQSGIDAASNGDTVIVSNGTYTSAGDKNLDTKGKAINVQSENGPEYCVIDCQGDGKGFSLHSYEEKDTVISGFTIINASEEGISCPGASPTINNCVITSCSLWGIDGGTPDITNCIINNNGSGGIFCGPRMDVYHFAVIKDCIISNNSSSFGGGVWFFDEGGEIINCIISGNQSLNGGGGIYCSRGLITIINCTITGNTSIIHGGAIADNMSYGTNKIYNSILWGNTPDEIYTDSGITVAFSDIQGGYVGEGNFSGDPIFLDKGNNDYHLDTRSPCIDVASSEDAPDTDIEGNARPQGSGCDIGAYEAAINGNRRPIVDSFAINSHEVEFPFEAIFTCSAHDTDGTISSYTIDYGDGNIETNSTGIFIHTYQDSGEGYATCKVLDDSGNYTNSVSLSIYQNGITRVPADYSTIQGAIDAAVNYVDFTVLVADGIYRGEGNRGLDFNGKAITVRSENGPEKTVIDCERYSNGAKFDNYETHDSVLDGFTIINSDYFYDTAAFIGGVECNNASPTISNCIIKHTNGSGIYIREGSPDIINCIIANNIAQDGGGIYCMSNSSPMISNCIISENIALNSYKGTHGGGGINIYDSTSTPVITNCVISDNISLDAGGGIRSSHSNYTMINCTVTGNIAYGGFGGIYHYTPEPYLPPEITNSILWGNSPDEINTGAMVLYSNIQGGYEGEGNISEDPGFYNSEAGDLRISSNSPCVDSAISAGSPETDIEGHVRPQGTGYDMGAYEAVENPPNFPFINSFSADIIEGDNPLEVAFTCDAEDPEGGSVSYTMDYGDGSDPLINNTGIFTHTYSTVGRYYAECHVADDDGHNVSSGFIRIQSHGTIRVPEDFETIQAAINASYNGDRILVADGTYTGTMNTGLRYNGKAVIVQSENGPETCIINNQGYGQGVTFLALDGRGSILSGFSIINGNKSGILCRMASPIISSCIIRNNTNPSGYGGGIQIDDYSEPIIISCYILNNQSERFGGGIYCNKSFPIISNCVIKGNRTVGHLIGEGGGIYNNNHSDTIISNCIISENSTIGSGGGIHTRVSYLSLENSIITNNSSGQYGGGIYCETSQWNGIIAWINNCTFSENNAEVDGGGSYFSLYGEAVVQNSIFWDDNPNEIMYEPPSGGVMFTPSISYCNVQGGYTGEGNISAYPLFVGYGDYHLTATSPCINAGTSSNAAIYDIDGETRPKGINYDIGVDEFYDSDSDGIPDYWELEWFKNLSHNTSTDADGDGLTDVKEFQYNTDPMNPDSDNDGMPDGWEMQYDFNPLMRNATDDWDNDGFTDLQEYLKGTDPTDPDSHPSRTMPWLPLLLE